MIFIAFFLITLKIIKQNCYNSNYSPNIITDDPINLEISCPNDEIQHIYLTNDKYIKYISIFNNSNVIISCSPLSAQSYHTNLNIYGNSTITIKDSCHFGNIEIHNSPTFQLNKNTRSCVDNLFLYNSTYQIPFEYKNIHITSNYEYNCGKNLIYYVNKQYIAVKCKNSIYYLDDKMPQKKFSIENGMVSIQNDDINEPFSDEIKIISNSINFTENKDVEFILFSNISEVTFYANLFSQKNVEFWIKSKYIFPFRCKDEHVFEKKGYEDIVSHGWGIVCNDSSPYLHYFYTDSERGKIIFVPKKVIVGVICFIVICVVVILASLFFIIYKRVDLSNTKNSENSELSQSLISL